MNTPPTPTSDLIKKAQIAYEGEEYREAAQIFEEAARQFSAQEDNLNAAEMLNNQSVSLLKAGDATGAYHAALGTDATFANAGDVKRQAMSLGNQAAALDELKKIDEAFALYQQSADLFKQIGEGELRAYVLQRMSALQMRSGKRLDALVTMQIALDAKPRLSLKDRILKGLMKTAAGLMGYKAE